MGIRFDEERKLFFLETEHTSYQMRIDSMGSLQHLYYGQNIGNADMSYLNFYIDRSFSGNPYEESENHSYSLDTVSHEYSGCGVGDYRISSILAVAENGSRSVDLRYAGHEIKKGKYNIDGMPSVRDDKGEAETLEVMLTDKVIGLSVKLLYGVFASKDIITRSIEVRNESDHALKIEKAASVCMDFAHGKWDLMHFHGRHCMEMQEERFPLTHDIVTVSSKRGMSSHHNNPFVILCSRDATEDSGDCYGFMMVYSGNHKEELEVSQYGSVRIVMGINDEGFCWNLKAHETFFAPEVILSHSVCGLNGLSRNYHRIIRENICPKKYRDVMRPILVNSWEAAYFDFNTDKILELAGQAAVLGIEMLVLDDGWFGQRSDDKTGLGDWYVNEDKISGGLRSLVEKVNHTGLKFGLWFEPEMINEDSNLYKAHPEWALCDPDRKPMVSRHQMVLDMSRSDVRDYLYDSISKILDSANIEYIKWDFNRSVANLYSGLLEPERQGEVAHRFVLGTYALLERITANYPDVMIEGCAGGGGRFDAGILYYSPQIWCSDDTDPIARLKIQKGASYGYPISAVGSHVSASPNHQTGRSTTLKTRGIVAMSGTFGYELDLGKLTKEEKEEVKAQIRDFKKYYWLIQKGDYYRLGDAESEQYFTAWEFVSKDKDEILFHLVVTNVQANAEFPFVKLKGLKEDAWYQPEGEEQPISGAALMHGGYAFPVMTGDYPCEQLYFKQIDIDYFK